MAKLTDTTTRLSQVSQGDVFLFICRVTSVDPTAGIGLAFFGPNRTKAANAVVHPDGTMTGNLVLVPDKIRVNIVTGLTPISVGDVLVNDATGETYVCRWSDIRPDGTVVWAASPSKTASIYPASGWTVVGNVVLS